eukprot:13215079-Alexandrium_andersonii.AAC.1
MAIVMLDAMVVAIAVAIGGKGMLARLARPSWAGLGANEPTLARGSGDCVVVPTHGHWGNWALRRLKVAR